MTRIPDSQRFRSNLAYVNQARSRAADANAIAASGMKHTRVSDDAQWARVKSANAEGTKANEQSQRNASAGRGRLDASDSALDQASSLLTRAQELAVQFANGTYTAAERTAGANEIAGLRESMLAVANTKTTDGYIFAGFQSDKEAFDSAGVFQGDSGNIQLDDGSSTNVSGAAVFQGGVDVFAVLASLEMAMRSNDPTAIRAQMSAVDASIDQVNNGRADVGARMQVLDTLTARLEAAQLQLDEQRAKDVEADPITAYSDLMQASTALEASLKVSAASMQKSLLDYI